MKRATTTDENSKLHCSILSQFALLNQAGRAAAPPIKFPWFHFPFLVSFFHIFSFNLRARNAATKGFQPSTRTATQGSSTKSSHYLHPSNRRRLQYSYYSYAEGTRDFCYVAKLLHSIFCEHVEGGQRRL